MKPGKIEVSPTVPLRNHEDLSRAYTPGVADAVRRIADDPAAAGQLTGKDRAIAVLSDGSAVLGVGDVGPLAALPVMEGKAALFKALAGVDAWPLCLRSREVEDVVRTVQDVSVTLAAVNLEDIAAPRCFEITRRLQAGLDIPVFHDDQHGTAVVVLAALRNALTVTGRQLGDVSVVVSGAGAAGSAVARLLLHVDVGSMVVCDSHGALHTDRDGVEGEKRWLAEHANTDRRQGPLADVLRGADVFIGVSAPGILREDDIAAMADDAIVFALANPDPEVDPEAARRHASVVATGRSDQPNQINNVLVFPGVFRGLLDGDVRTVDEDVLVDAADAIAGLVDNDALGPEAILPDVFDDRLVAAVAGAVAGRRSGVPANRATDRTRRQEELA